MEWIRWRPQYLLIYVLCCLISNFEVFRLLNSEVFEALSLIKKLKLLIQKTGCMCVFKDTILITKFIERGKTKKQFLRSWSLKLVKLACIGFIIRRLFLRFQFRWSSDDLLWTVITTYISLRSATFGLHSFNKTWLSRFVLFSTCSLIKFKSCNDLII